MLKKQIQICKAIKSNCSKCKKMGHYQQEFWTKDVNEIDSEEKIMQNVDIHQEKFDPTIWNQNKDFKVDKILVDTGAKISTSGLKKAKKWELTQVMCLAKHKIKAYNSPIILLLVIAP